MIPVQIKGISWHKNFGPIGALAMLHHCVLPKNFSIKGVVTDKNGEPIVGATVLEQQTKNGVATDLDGRFSIRVSNEKAILRISYIGFKPQEVGVNGKSTLNITLQDDAAANLNEVVVVGYGTMDKKNLHLLSHMYRRPISHKLPLLTPP